MNKVALIILIILILGLIIYSFLGNKEGFTNSSSESKSPNMNLVDNPKPESNSSNDLFPYTGVYKSNNYDNYNHFDGSQTPLIPGTYHEPKGGSVNVSTNSDGSISIKEKDSDKIDVNIYTSLLPSSTSNSTSNTSSTIKSNPVNTSVYYGLNGGSASIVTLSNGQQEIQVMQPNGSTVIYSPSGNLPQTNDTLSNNINSSEYFGSTGTSIPSNFSLAYNPSGNTMNSGNTMGSSSNMMGSSSNMNNSSSSSSPGKYQTILYGPNGAIAVVNNSTNSIMVIQNGVSTNYINQNPGSSSSSSSSSVLKSSNGGTITVSLVNNQFNLSLVDQYGNTETFTMNPSQNNSSFNLNQYNGTTLYGPNGSSATINSNTINITSNGTTTTYKSYSYGSPNVFVNTSGGTAVVSPVNNSFVLIVIDQYGNTQVFNVNNQNNQNNQMNNNNSSFFSNPFSNNPFFNSSFFSNPFSNNPYYSGQNSQMNNYNSNPNNYSPYSSALPSGIPGSQIPPGKQDLYILKSEVIPPVCPACPSVKVCDKKEKCPCPACARCPEPSFECKKVPNYNSSYYDSGYSGSSGSSGFDSEPFEIGGKTLPVPVLSDFSTFGM